MTDSLLDLTPVFAMIQAFVEQFGGYIAVPLGVWLGMFMVGAVIEAVKSSRQSSSE